MSMTGINRNIMEFKLVKKMIYSNKKTRINRNIMEFKEDRCDPCSSSLDAELIES